MTVPASLSREYLRSLAPNRLNRLNAFVEDYYIREFVKAAQEGFNVFRRGRHFYIDLDQLGNVAPNDPQTFTSEEIIECLRSKCGDCEITWEINPVPHSESVKNLDITVRW
jgi:hypothetical protein